MAVCENKHEDVINNSVIVEDLVPVLSAKKISSSPKDENKLFTVRTMVRCPLTILKHVP